MAYAAIVSRAEAWNSQHYGGVLQTRLLKAPGKSKKTGVRELLKQESQYRIMMAARQLFAELGYDRATLRQIAAAAGLTVGALFNHVTDKRDLIYLIFNEEVRTLTDKALASPRPYQTLSAKILSIAEHYFRLFGSEPVLSRILLTEVVSQAPGLHLEEYLSMRTRLLSGLEHIIAEAQRSGEIMTDESAEVMARHIFFTFAASLRWWLANSPQPEWRNGRREYERLLKLQIDGFLPAVTKVETVDARSKPAGKERARKPPPEFIRKNQAKVSRDSDRSASY